MNLFIEGINGSGKSTLCNLLDGKYINGVQIKLVRRDERANNLLSMLGDKSIDVDVRVIIASAFHAYMISRADPSCINLYDRSIISTLAMQCYMEGGDPTLLEPFKNTLTDSKCILLTLPPSEVRGRLDGRCEDRSGKDSFDYMTPEQYATLQAQFGLAANTVAVTYTISSTSIDFVVNKAYEIIGELLNALY